MSQRIAVIDYGMGNLRNVARTLERAGAKPRVTTDPDQIRRVIVNLYDNAASVPLRAWPTCSCASWT